MRKRAQRHRRQGSTEPVSSSVGIHRMIRHVRPALWRRGAASGGAVAVRQRGAGPRRSARRDAGGVAPGAVDAGGGPGDDDGLRRASFRRRRRRSRRSPSVGCIRAGSAALPAAAPESTPAGGPSSGCSPASPWPRPSVLSSPLSLAPAASRSPRSTGSSPPLGSSPRRGWLVAPGAVHVAAPCRFRRGAVCSASRSGFALEHALGWPLTSGSAAARQLRQPGSSGAFRYPLVVARSPALVGGRLDALDGAAPRQTGCSASGRWCSPSSDFRRSRADRRAGAAPSV